jgi:hypothetical protein
MIHKWVKTPDTAYTQVISTSAILVRIILGAVWRRLVLTRLFLQTFTHTYTKYMSNYSFDKVDGDCCDRHEKENIYWSTFQNHVQNSIN